MDLELLQNLFVDSLKADNYAKATCESYVRNLGRFRKFLSDHFMVKTVGGITQKIVEAYIEYLGRQKSGKTENKLSGQVITNMCGQLKIFFLYLIRNGHMREDLTGILEGRKRPKPIVHNILTEREIQKILNLPDVSTFLGFRDKVMFELAYNTGLRRAEITALEIYDLELGDRTLFVRQGKGKKDRLVPVGSYLVKYLQEYLDKVRPGLVKDHGTDALFVNNSGRPFKKSAMQNLLDKYKQLGGVHFTWHTFRHCFATHMLKYGAGLLHIQRILGHSHPSTTEIYTKVYPVDLIEIIDEKHPRSARRIAEEVIVRPEPGKRFNLPLAEAKKLLTEGGKKW